MSVSTESLCCPPPCAHPLIKSGSEFLCTNKDCAHSKAENAFRRVDESLVLISEMNCDTVCRADRVSSYVPRPKGKLYTLKSQLLKESEKTKQNCRLFVDQVLKRSKHPRVLVIGSGAQGAGTEALWASEAIDITGVDIYASPSVDIVCDAHYLPFAAESFDAVWIQAVLEHVVDPNHVAEEIYRVLKTDGIIYAETPFMQQVHEGAYDFTRFTVLGHRYLFKKFRLIEMGGVTGVDISLAWSVRYFVWGLFRSQKLAKVIGSLTSLILSPVRVFLSSQSFYDGPSGVFFLGQKSDRLEVTHKELISLYQGNMT